MIDIINIIKKINTVSICFVIAIFLTACVNDVDEVNEFVSTIKLPVQTADSIEIVQTDSSNIQVKVFAPLLERYIDKEEPYSIFPEGIEVIGYDIYPDTSYSIIAEYAINYETEKLWEARNDVVVITAENEQINTEQLFWDEEKAIIYSDKFTRITNKDGIFYGEAGFEAKENGTKWKLKNIKNSTVNVEDE